MKRKARAPVPPSLGSHDECGEDARDVLHTIEARAADAVREQRHARSIDDSESPVRDFIAFVKDQSQIGFCRRMMRWDDPHRDERASSERLPCLETIMRKRGIPIITIAVERGVEPSNEL